MEITKRGPAAVQVCSTVFVKMGEMQARALGRPGLPIVAVPHPFGSRSRDEIRRIAESLADEIARIMAKDAA